MRSASRWAPRIVYEDARVASTGTHSFVWTGEAASAALCLRQRDAGTQRDLFMERGAVGSLLLGTCCNQFSAAPGAARFTMASNIAQLDSHQSEVALSSEPPLTALSAGHPGHRRHSINNFPVHVRGHERQVLVETACRRLSRDGMARLSPCRLLSFVFSSCDTIRRRVGELNRYAPLCS